VPQTRGKHKVFSYLGQACGLSNSMNQKKLAKSLRRVLIFLSSKLRPEAPTGSKSLKRRKTQYFWHVFHRKSRKLDGCHYFSKTSLLAVAGCGCSCGCAWPWHRHRCGHNIPICSGRPSNSSACAHTGDTLKTARIHGRCHMRSKTQ